MDDGHFANSGLLTISIFFWEAAKKNSKKLTERLGKTATDYGTEISSDKSKILVNGINPRPFTNMRMNGKVFEEVDQFKYFGSTQIKNGRSLKEAKIKLEQVHSAMTSLAVLSVLWNKKLANSSSQRKLSFVRCLK